MIERLMSCVCLLVILVVAWVLSRDRGRMNWRVIGVGVGLQLALGALVFLTAAGRSVFLAINDAVVWVLGPANEGTLFLFDVLAVGRGEVAPSGHQGLSFILAFQGLPLIIVFSAIAAMLYYIGVLPFLIKAFAAVFSKLMKVSGAEALCASSNIFVGVESATAIRPYLSRLTRSELCTVLTAGMATVASNVMAFYVFILSGTFPTIAGHLVSASVLSAPAALVLSKIILPETETPETLGENLEVYQEKHDSLFDALIDGSNQGLQLIFGVSALLIAMLGIVGIVNALLGLIDPAVSLEAGLAYIFYPFVCLLGIPGDEAWEAAKILGMKPIKTEVAGYFQLAGMANQLSPRTVIVTAYALCGFTHVASVAIFVGGIAALAPERRKDLIAVAWRAFIAATLACLMTASVAGIFFSGDATLTMQ